MVIFTPFHPMISITVSFFVYFFLTKYNVKAPIPTAIPIIMDKATIL